MLMRGFLTLALCLTPCLVYSQTPSPSPSASASASPMPTLQISDRDIDAKGALEISDHAPYFTERRSTAETQLGWGILIFGFLIIGLEVLVMLRLKKGWGTQSIRVVGLTLVLTSGLFLIVTGYSQEQIAPMIGLLGTITGFLLGKTASGKESE